MIPNNYFLVILVYRLDRDKYYDQMQNHIDKIFESDNDIVKKAFENDPNLKTQYESHLRKSYGGSWEFNEIIGYIKLYFYGTQIRGEYWKVNAKKIVKTKKKQFEFENYTLAYELTISDKTSSGILKTVRTYIENCSKELKNCFLDMSDFDMLAPYINWESLYKEKIRI